MSHNGIISQYDDISYDSSGHNLFQLIFHTTHVTGQITNWPNKK